MQLQTDLSGIPVLRPKTADLSALGTAHLAGLAAGLWSLEDLDALPRPQDEFTPASSQAWRKDKVASWRAAVRRARYQPL
jgi:glycerol kinase